MKIRIKKQQNKDIGLNLLNAFDYLKSLSQEAKDFMDEIEDVNKDINVKKLVLLVVIRKNLTLTSLGCH